MYLHSVCVCLYIYILYVCACVCVCFLAADDAVMASSRGREKCESGLWTLCKLMQSFPLRLKVNTLTFWGGSDSTLSLCLFVSFSRSSLAPNTCCPLPILTVAYLHIFNCRVLFISVLTFVRRKSRSSTYDRNDLSCLWGLLLSGLCYVTFTD